MEECFRFPSSLTRAIQHDHHIPFTPIEAVHYESAGAVNFGAAAQRA